MVARLAEQLSVDEAEIRAYGRRIQTRSDHVRLVAQYLGWRSAGGLELKELDEFLLVRIDAATESGCCRNAKGSHPHRNSRPTSNRDL